MTSLLRLGSPPRWSLSWYVARTTGSASLSRSVSSSSSIRAAAAGNNNNNNNNNYNDIRSGSSASSTNSPRRGVALVVGSSGALGSSVSHHLSREVGMRVIGADVVGSPHDSNKDRTLDAYIRLAENATITELGTTLYQGVHRALNDLSDSDDGLFLDAIVCANGGWQGDPPPPSTVRGLADDDHDDDDDTIPKHIHEAASVLERMVSVNLNPVLAVSLCARHCCANNALVVIVGATAALQPTPGMVGYGLSKAAVHHVVQTMGTSSTRGMNKPRKGTRHATDPHFPTVIGILPSTLDTPNNRKSMPHDDASRWTHPADISAQIGIWLSQPSLRPAAGSLVKVQSDHEGKATFELVR